MKIVVKLPMCDGNGNCAQEAPHLFRLDENDQLHILKEELSEADVEPARRAAAACPKYAIRLKS